MQLAVVQIKAAREAAQEMWTVCASNEHDFSIVQERWTLGTGLSRGA